MHVGWSETPLTETIREMTMSNESTDRPVDVPVGLDWFCRALEALEDIHGPKLSGHAFNSPGDVHDPKLSGHAFNSLRAALGRVEILFKSLPDAPVTTSRPKHVTTEA